jgi:hypothetical protein
VKKKWNYQRIGVKSFSFVVVLLSFHVIGLEMVITSLVDVKVNPGHITIAKIRFAIK